MANQSVHKRKPSVAPSKNNDSDAPRRGPGRPRKDPGEVKRQVAFFLTDEERRMLKEMALLWGCTASQFLANLIRDNYKSKRYMKGFNQLSQDERAELVSQRQTTQFITSRREQTAMQRNLDRRMGMDRSLTNVMVIAAPQAVTQSAVRNVALQDGINVPGIYCKNLGDVWIVPYGQLYRISVVEIIQYPCYASVLDYFAGKRIAPGLLSDFIDSQHDFKLSSMGEKAVQERLAKVYGTIRYPVKESFELKRRERMIAESQQTMAQMLAELSPEARSTLDHINQNAAYEAESYAQAAKDEEPVAPMPEPVTPKTQRAAVQKDLSTEAAAIIPEPNAPGASGAQPEASATQPDTSVEQAESSVEHVETSAAQAEVSAAQPDVSAQPEVDVEQTTASVEPAETSAAQAEVSAVQSDVSATQAAVSTTQADDSGEQAEASATHPASVQPDLVAALGFSDSAADTEPQAVAPSSDVLMERAFGAESQERVDSELGLDDSRARVEPHVTAPADAALELGAVESKVEPAVDRAAATSSEVQSEEAAPVEVPEQTVLHCALQAQPETMGQALAESRPAAERGRSRLLRRRPVMRQRQQLEVVLGQGQDPDVPSAPFLAEPDEPTPDDSTS